MVNEPGCVAWPVRSRSVNNAEEYFSNGRKDSDNFRVSIRIEEMDRTENGIHFHWETLEDPSQITNIHVCVLFYIPRYIISNEKYVDP